MRNTIAWSYGLLNDMEKKLFCWLAVFAGGFTLDAAEFVQGKIGDKNSSAFDRVSSLLDQSMLRRRKGLEDEFRFYIRANLMREFGINYLSSCGELEEAQEAHAEFFLSLTEKAEPELKGPQQVLWLKRLEQEHDNLRVVLGWAKDTGNIEIGLRLASAMSRFWEVRGYLTEGRQWIDEFLANAAHFKVPLVLCGKASNAAGILARNQGDYQQATDHLNKGLELSEKVADNQGKAVSLNFLGLVAYDQSNYFDADRLLKGSLSIFRELNDQHGLGSVLNNLAILKHFQGEYEHAIPFYQECAAIQRKLKDLLGLASSLMNLGLLASDQKDFDRASDLFAEGQELFEKLGDKIGIAGSFTNLGEVAQYKGDYEQAKVLYKKALSLFQETGDKREEATVMNGLADIARLQGDYEQALKLYQDSLELRQSIGEKASIIFSLEGLAHLAFAEEQIERATLLFGAADFLRESTRTPLPPARLDEHKLVLDSIQKVLGDEDFQDLFQQGRSLNFKVAVSYAKTNNLSNSSAK